MELKDLTWPMVEAYLSKKQSIIVPIGSTEQHGPTGLIGTDYLTASSISLSVGKELNCLVAPSLNFGMAVHHMAFPGTISLDPDVYCSVIQNLIRSLQTHGFTKILFINGHGGNIVPVTNSFCQIKTNSKNECSLFLENWWRNDKVREYEEEHFGDENGTHATCGEVSLTMYDHAEAFKNIENTNFEIEKVKLPHYPLAADEFRKYYPDGRMGSNPGLSSFQHGKAIKEIAVTEILEKYKEVL